MKLFTTRGILFGISALLLIVLGGWVALSHAKAGPTHVGGLAKINADDSFQESDDAAQNSDDAVVSASHGEHTKGSFMVDLTEAIIEADWFFADFSFPSKHYATGWARDHIVLSEAGLSISIDRQPTEYQPHTGGEFQREGFYGYGRYEVIMRPAKGSGLVSSFFIYTGSPFGHPHDEIDIEFLGNDTSKVQFNIFADGNTWNPPLVELGFDASEDFNAYAIEWMEDEIRWYVNGKRRFSVSKEDRKLPSNPGKIMINLWTGKPGLFAWHGRPDFANGTSAEYKCISFRRAGEESKQCSDKHW